MESETPDAELMRAVAAGDDFAFQKLVERHQRAVYGTAVKMLGDAIEAEDIAQRVFVRVYRAAPSYQPTAQFRTWLFTILRNMVFNEHRRRGRATLVPLDIPSDETDRPDRERPEMSDPRVKSPDRAALDGEMMQAIDEAILSLPEQQRLAVVLRRYDEMPYEEIAAVLKTSVSSVKSLLFRARESLRQALARYLDQ